MATPMGGGYSAPPQVSFDWLSKGWEYFKQQPGEWILASLVYVGLTLAVILAIAIPTGIFTAVTASFHPAGSGSPFGNPFLQSGVTSIANIILGIVAGGVQFVLLGGFYRMALQQIRGQAAGVAAIFSIGDVALSLAVYGLVASVLIRIASICCVPGIIVSGLLIFGPLLIVDGKSSGVQAISDSINMLKSQWLMATLFWFVGVLFVTAGAIALCVGVFVTAPIFYLAIAYGYTTFTGFPPGQGPNYGQPVPGTWPPPPGAPQPPTPFGQQPPPSQYGQQAPAQSFGQPQPPYGQPPAQFGQSPSQPPPTFGQSHASAPPLSPTLLQPTPLPVPPTIPESAPPVPPTFSQPAPPAEHIFDEPEDEQPPFAT